MSDDMSRGDGKLRQLEPDTLRDEYQVPELRGLLLAFFEMMVGRIRAIEAYRDAGSPTMNFLDLTILVYCFIWAREGGARAQHIINTIDLPRRTVRDSLDKLVAGGNLIRAEDGSYYPTDFAGSVANGLYHPWMNELRNLCDAYAEFASAGKKD
jgi:hypothetical protein